MTKKHKKEVNKIVAGLKEAVALAEQPKLEYDRIAERVLAAVEELNNSLKEAHHCAEMRVFMGASGKGEETPMQFKPQIYRLTHSTMVFTIKYNLPDGSTDSKPMWQQVKDPAFQDAAGQGLRALQKKKT